jgi:putative membrane protein
MPRSGRHTTKPPGREPILLLAGVLAALIGSGISPHDRLTWCLEVAPVLLAVPLLLATATRFPLTPLAYRLIFIHCLILIVGGHYTYERVPVGEWARAVLDLGRNHYDRLGHFAQGFIPAILTREVLLRRTPLRPGGWLFFLTTAVCLAISASFEFVEWTAATFLGQSADAHLAMQGDVWDTQWDMLCALSGATAALLSLGRQHDREIARLAGAAITKLTPGIAGGGASR